MGIKESKSKVKEQEKSKGFGTAGGPRARDKPAYPRTAEEARAHPERAPPRLPHGGCHRETGGVCESL